MMANNIAEPLVVMLGKVIFLPQLKLIRTPAECHDMAWQKKASAVSGVWQEGLIPPEELRSDKEGNPPDQ